MRVRVGGTVTDAVGVYVGWLPGIGVRVGVDEGATVVFASAVAVAVGLAVGLTLGSGEAVTSGVRVAVAVSVSVTEGEAVVVVVGAGGVVGTMASVRLDVGVGEGVDV